MNESECLDGGGELGSLFCYSCFLYFCPFFLLFFFFNFCKKLWSFGLTTQKIHPKSITRMQIPGGAINVQGQAAVFLKSYHSFG